MGVTRRGRSVRRPLAASLVVVLVVGLGGYVVAGAVVRNSADTALAEARQLLAKSDSDAVRDRLRWLLWYEPRHPEALFLTGQSYQQEGEFEAAASAYSLVPVESRKHRQAGFAEAIAYLSDARFGETERALIRHLEAYPDSMTAYEELKWLYYNQFRERELEEFLLDRLRRDPGDYVVLRDLILTEIREQVAEEAIVHVSRAFEHRPEEASVTLAFAYCQWRLGNVDKARTVFDQALKMRPDHLETRLIVAEFLLEQDELEAVEQMLLPQGRGADILRQRLEQDDRWWQLRSRLARRRNDSQKSLEYSQRALELRPFELSLLQETGQLLLAAGHEDESRELLREANVSAAAEQELFNIVMDDSLDQPTRELCLELSRLCELRGRSQQAAGWRILANRLGDRAGENAARVR